MFTTSDRKAAVSVINDLSSDARVSKVCIELQALGYEVVCIGRELPDSKPISGFSYATERMKLLFKKGVFFYLFFNLRLFFKLLFKRNISLLYANDLDTLLPNYVISKWKNIPLIYDSHELFCEVPELQQTPIKKRIWERLESRIVPKLKYCITVNESIAGIFESKYRTKFHVIRNIPKTIQVEHPKSRADLGMPADKAIVIYQGAGINIQRGAEELVTAFKYIDDAVLYIIGSGDVWTELKRIIGKEQLSKKVTLIERIPKTELLEFTMNADLGISIDKDTNLNYRYSLPNKIFDYINCGVPILASHLPEIEKIISHYNIGSFIDSHDPAHIAERIKESLNKENQKKWREGIKKAKKELTWEEEKKVFINLVQSIQ